MKEDLRNFTLEELRERFKRLNIEPFRAQQVFLWMYKKGVQDFSEMKNLSSETKELIKQYFILESLGIEEIETSSDLTQKFLFKLSDGLMIESVSIPRKERMTACLSTQVGCKFSCAFCASGATHFKRNLDTSEIIAQFISIRNNVSTQKLTNVVFMGIGEPLDNYDNLLRSVRILNSEAGANLGIRKMTISTCGLADGIKRLAQEGLEIELSVSLHSAVDKKRSQIVPVNRKYPLEVLMEAVKGYIEATHRKVTFEYVMLGGFNTLPEDAQSLIKLLRGINAKVNLIPYNEIPGFSSYAPPSKMEVLFFKSFLAKNGIDATVRMPRGRDISAACGQLKAKVLKKGNRTGEDR